MVSPANDTAVAFILAKDPDGNTITSGVGGWTFSAPSGTFAGKKIVITPPPAIVATLGNFMRVVPASLSIDALSPGTIISSFAIASTSGSYVTLDATKTSIHIYFSTSGSTPNAQIGVDATGTKYVYILCSQISSSSIFI